MKYNKSAMKIRAPLRPEVLTTRPHTDLYLRSDFILMWFGNMVKTKEMQFSRFPGKSDLFGKNPVLPIA